MNTHTREKPCICTETVHSPDTCNPHCGCPECWDTGGWTEEVTPEQLRLERAAPALLAALTDLVEGCKHWSNQNEPLLVAARSAIALALTPTEK